MASEKPRVAVYKFSSCDGCQLQLLNLENELLDLVGAVEIAYFLEARRRVLPPPYNIGLGRGQHFNSGRRRTHPAGPARLQILGRHRRMRHVRRNSGTAELGQCGRICPHRLCQTGVYFHARNGLAHRGACVRRF